MFNLIHISRRFYQRMFNLIHISRRFYQKMYILYIFQFYSNEHRNRNQRQYFLIKCTCVVFYKQYEEQQQQSQLNTKYP